MLFLTLTLGCAPDVEKDTPLPEFLVGDLDPAATGDFGSWDARVYLMRPSMLALGEAEPETYAPYAVGEAYSAPLAFPFDGGLDTLAEGCMDADTFAELELPLADVGATMPLTVAGYTVDLERETWDTGIDYWWDPVAEIECGCAPGTTVAFPEVPDQAVTVPEPVALADGFAAAWADWQDTGVLDLAWTPGGGNERVHVQGWDTKSGDWRTCFLDDDGRARVELPQGDTVRLMVDRVATESVAHPTYGTTQLSVQTYVEIHAAEAR